MRFGAALLLTLTASAASAAPTRSASVDEISAALGNPANLSHSKLKTGRIEMVDHGVFGAEPWMKSGANAWVFKGYDADGKPTALRMSMRPTAAQTGRYQALAKFLTKRKALAIVPFEYAEQGLAVSIDGELSSHPVLYLDWARGERIDHHVGKLAEAGDQKKLGALAADFRKLMTRLHVAKVAHGDLQHGNIHVDEKGALQLLDPDAMYVPGLEAFPSNELGHRNFQHPEVMSTRTREFGPHMDHFSALTIYLSLRALETDPSLWAARRSDEGLLFSDRDFHDPEASTMIAALRESRSEEVRQLTAELVSVLAQPASHAKHLDELLPAAAKKTRAPRKILLQAMEVHAPAEPTLTLAPRKKGELSGDVFAEFGGK